MIIGTRRTGLGARSWRCRRAATRCRGQAAIGAALVSLLLLILGLTSLMIAHAELRAAVRNDNFSKVQLAAESGIEYAQAMMLSTPGRSPYHGGMMPVPVNGMTVTVSDPTFIVAAGEEDIYHLTSSARRGTIFRLIDVDLAISADRTRCRILNWKEYPSRVLHR